MSLIDPHTVANASGLGSGTYRDTLALLQEDGLSDDLEDTLGTDKTNKSGDKDKDGLYDFEEYLDHYGTPDDTTDAPKYNYNDSTSYGEVLDIYHYFNLSSNKTGYLRDQIFTQQNGGFTDHLLWNVNFTTDSAGGSINSNVIYSNNVLTDVFFKAALSGGSSKGDVNYNGNIMTNVGFDGGTSGGGDSGSADTNYNGNIMTNVNFTGVYAGGSIAKVTYSNNRFTNVIFSGLGAGAAVGNDFATYSNNTLTNVNFTGNFAGGGVAGVVTYSNNRFTNVGFGGTNAGRSRDSTSSYTDNVIANDSYDNDSDGLGDTWELIYHSISGIDPLVAANTSVLTSDLDTDGLTLTEEAKAYSNPQLKDTDGDGLNDSYEVDLNTNPQLKDTDGDGLPDGWEVRYSSVSGVNPGIAVTTSELASDTDKDDLNLTEEFEAGTNPASNDTDGDGLPDGWEVRYSSVSGVDPIVAANATELASDTDGDSLTLLQEAKANTDPTSNDTDGDGLPDGWEVRYSSVSGVNATVAATATELSSDTDGDGLTLLQEAEANTDPGTADNPMSISSTNTAASSSDGGISPILLIFLVILLILALIAIVIIGTIVFFYKEVVGIFDKVKDKLFDEK